MTRASYNPISVTLIVALALVCLFNINSADADPSLRRKLQVTREAPSNAVIPNSYIVELKGTTESSRQDVVTLAKSHLGFDYSHVLNGFSIKDATDQIVEDLLNSPNVKAIYEDTRIELHQSSKFTQTGATWGLDRIDARSGLDGSYRYDSKGDDVTVFIVDSGVLQSHSEFSGRFAGCRDFVGTNCNSPDFHGTHVAGTAVGATYGVAKGAKVFDMKVCTDRDGCATSAVIAALNEIIALKNSGDKFVANLSIGGFSSTAMNTAVNNLANAGVVVVVSAGNDNKDACSHSPASATASGVITVASTTSSDSRSSFSNYGPCVDIFAPGSEITSASNNGGTASASGTSMAAPHVAGLAALFLSQGRNAVDTIRAQATTNAVSNAGSGSPNLLAFNGVDQVPAVPVTPQNPQPVSPPVSSPASSPSSGNNPGSAGCFSASSLVPVIDKKPTKMTDLKIGDKILTTNGYESIYAFAHNDTHTPTNFLQLHTSTGKLVLTGEHLVYLHGKENPVRGSSIKIGDKLQSLEGGGEPVTMIDTIEHTGLHAPLTPSGTIIVDGFVASCYISFFPERDPEYLDAKGVVGALLSHHQFAHMGLSLLRIGCSAVPSLCRMYNDKGTLSFMQFGVSLFHSGSRQPQIAQDLLLFLYICVLSPIAALEFLFGSRLAGCVFLACIVWCTSCRRRKVARLDASKSKKIDC